VRWECRSLLPDSDVFLSLLELCSSLEGSSFCDWSGIGIEKSSSIVPVTGAELLITAVVSSLT